MESTPLQDVTGGLQRGIKIHELLTHSPMWDKFRADARRAYSVYDGDGLLSPEAERVAEELGKPTRKINLVKKTAQTLIGNAQQLTTDKILVADDDESREISEAMNARASRNWRMTEASEAEMRAHQDQVVVGVGWLNVRRNRSNLFGYKYAVDYVDWEEMKWDLYSIKNGWDQCRWVARERKYHVDTVMTMFPRHKELIQRYRNVFEGATFDAPHMESINFDYNQLFDEDRQLIVVREAYERVPSRQMLIMTEDGTVSEITPGVEGELFEGTAVVIKKSIFIGDVKVWHADYESKHPAFVPMFAHMKHGTNVPCGPVADMIDPVYNYNNITNEQLHILSTCKIKIKPDSLSDEFLEEHGDNVIEAIRRECLRRDGVIPIARDARLEDVEIIREWQELQNLQAMKMDAYREIQDVSGISPEMSGMAQGDRQSARAIESIAQLSSANVATILNSKAEAGKRVAEVMNGFEIKDIGNNPAVIPVTSNLNGKMRQVQLNSVGDDGVISNDLTKARMHFEVADIKSSPGFRQQKLSQVENAMNKLGNSEFAPYLFEAWMKNSEIPGMHEILQKYYLNTGQAATAEEMAEKAAAQAEQQQIAAELEQQSILVDNALKEAQAEQARAVARKALTDAEGEDPTLETRKIESESRIMQIKERIEEVKLQQAQAKVQEAARNAKLQKLDAWQQRAGAAA